jgi:hypothetical protein
MLRMYIYVGVSSMLISGWGIRGGKEGGRREYSKRGRVERDEKMDTSRSK